MRLASFSRGSSAGRQHDPVRQRDAAGHTQYNDANGVRVSRALG